MKDKPYVTRLGTDVPRVGLALAGGGPLGMIYEIGALRALDEALEGVDFNNLDVYVGVSAGAAIAANLANQLTTAQMCRVFIRGEAIEHPFNPDVFLKPAFKEYYNRLLSVPRLFIQSVWRFARNPFDISLVESLTSLSQAFPTGVFNNEAIFNYLNQLYSVSERTNDFRELHQKLYVVAVDLDTGEPVRFGSKGYDHVPIAKAVQASTALPGLYPPVKIDGRYYVDGALTKTMHASVALSEGADLVFCVNPLVPFDANLAAHVGTLNKHESLVEKGLAVVLSQAFRTIIHSRLEVGMSSYDTQYENADVVLFEPNREDPKVFFANVFSFSNRLWVCEHAYQTTRHDLLARHNELGALLNRHNISLRMDILEDKTRHFSTGLHNEDPEMDEAVEDLMNGSNSNALQESANSADWFNAVHKIS